MVASTPAALDLGCWDACLVGLAVVRRRLDKDVVVALVIQRGMMTETGVAEASFDLLAGGP